MFKVKDIMNTTIVAIAENDTIDHAISLLVEHRISGLPVTDGDGCLVGVLSEFDLLELICDCRAEKDAVGHYMTRDVRSVDEELGWVEVADTFRRDHLRRLPVTRDGRLVGIVSRHDLMRAAQEARQRVRKALAGGPQVAAR